MGISEHTTAIAAVALLVILSVAVLIPVVSNANVTTVSNTNIGDQFSPGATTISLSDGVFTADGVTVTPVTSLGVILFGPALQLTSDGLRYYHDGTLSKIPAGTTATSWTFELDERGNFTFETSNDETAAGYSQPNRTFHIVTEGGTMVRYNSPSSTTPVPQPGSTQFFNSGAYIVLYAFGGYTNNNWTFVDGAVSDVMRGYTYTGSTSNNAAAYNVYPVAVEGQNNVYTYGGAVNVNNPTSTNNALNALIPLEYTTEAAAEGTVYTIINIVPILAMIGIAVVAIGVFIRRD